MDGRPSLFSADAFSPMIERVADMIETEIEAALYRNGRCSLALSGGSTPIPLYKTLASRSLDWAKVTLTLVDERWCGPSDPGSNESAIRRAFAEGGLSQPPLIGLWTDGVAFHEAAQSAGERLCALNGELDIVIMGMGEDGHTASWFPHADGLGTALAQSFKPQVPATALTTLVARQSPVTGNYLERISFTLPAITAARRIYLLMRGEQKRSVFETARNGSDVEAMPVRALWQARGDMLTFWAP